MLISRRMKNHIRMVALKYLNYSRTVRHVPKVTLHFQLWVRFQQLHLNSVEVEFTVIENNQATWSQTSQLPAKLRPD